jgi:hypothetical protein
LTRHGAIERATQAAQTLRLGVPACPQSENSLAPFIRIWICAINAVVLGYQGENQIVVPGVFQKSALSS